MHSTYYIIGLLAASRVLQVLLQKEKEEEAKGTLSGMAAVGRASSGKALACVIGASGFVGSHVVKALVDGEWNVKAVSRSATSQDWLKNLAAPGQVELADLDLGVGSIRLRDELDTLMQGCKAVFFAAGHEKSDRATIDFMVNSAVEVVKAAARTGVQVVVLTSSGGSTNPPGLPEGTPKNEVLHWSDPEQQIQAGKYSPAAKTLMEVQSLQAMGRDQQNVVQDKALSAKSPRLCIMNPNLILGPQLQPGPVKGNSLPWIVKILTGEVMNESIPNDSMSIIDVRDLAALHVACAETPTASGRYFGVNQSWPWSEILDTFHQAYPAYRPPPMFPGEARTPTQFDHSRKDSLGVPLRTLQTTLGDLISYLVETKMIAPKKS